jgi:hypothetical protein
VTCPWSRSAEIPGQPHTSLAIFRLLGVQEDEVDAGGVEHHEVRDLGAHQQGCNHVWRGYILKVFEILTFKHIVINPRDEDDTPWRGRRDTRMAGLNRWANAQCGGTGVGWFEAGR